MRAAYPTFIKKSKKYYLAYVPDMDLYTQGKDFCDAIDMARDAISLNALSLEDSKQKLPKPSNSQKAIELAKKDADNDLDFSSGELTFVDIDTDSYRNKIRNTSVRKNCTIPRWLNEKAEAQGINFSRVLQDALISILGQN